MSLALLPLIWRMKPGILTSSEKIVLLRLADFAQEDGSSIYPCLKRIAEETSLSLRTVQRAITELLEKGCLQLVQSFTSRKPNIYQINVSFLRSVLKPTEEEGNKTPVQGCHPATSEVLNKGVRDDKVSPQGRHDDIPRPSSAVIVSSQRGHHDISRGDIMTPDPLYNPLKEPLTLLPGSGQKPGEGETHDSDQGEKFPHPELGIRSQQEDILLREKFNQWYACYPRKVSRKKALSAFGHALKRQPFEALLALTQAYAKTVADRDPQYLPYPATWLNGERWEDVEEVYKSDQNSRPQNSRHDSANQDSDLPYAGTGMHPSLQEFVRRHPQLHNNAAFLIPCQVKDQGDRILLESPSPFYGDKVEYYYRELERYYGKPVRCTVWQESSGELSKENNDEISRADREFSLQSQKLAYLDSFLDQAVGIVWHQGQAGTLKSLPS